jgi:hypothetical protein
VTVSIDDDLATVQRLLVGERSIPRMLRMHEGLDEDAYTELTGALERLIDHYAGRTEVPKALGLAFVDVGTAFDYAPGTYPHDELERIEDAGQELSQMGQMLFGSED